MTHTRSPRILIAALSTATFAFAAPAFADDCNYKKSAKAQTTYQTAANQTSVMDATIHSASMQYQSDTIIDAALATDELSTLVAAVKAAGLVDTLSGDGPFTVFAPTNGAFANLPAGTVASLLEPQNKDQLTRVLTSHVVAGNLSGADIVATVKANGGKAYVTTLSGAKLKVKQYGDALIIKDENGGKSTVAIADIMKSNGTVHVIDGVLLPGAASTS